MGSALPHAALGVGTARGAWIQAPSEWHPPARQNLDRGRAWPQPVTSGILDCAPIGLEEAKPLHGCAHAEPPCPPSCFRKKAGRGKKGGCGGILDFGS